MKYKNSFNQSKEMDFTMKIAVISYSKKVVSELAMSNFVLFRCHSFQTSKSINMRACVQGVRKLCFDIYAHFFCCFNVHTAQGQFCHRLETSDRCLNPEHPEWVLQSPLGLPVMEKNPDFNVGYHAFEGISKRAMKGSLHSRARSEVPKK